MNILSMIFSLLAMVFGAQDVCEQDVDFASAVEDECPESASRDVERGTIHSISNGF